MKATVHGFLSYPLPVESAPLNDRVMGLCIRVYAGFFIPVIHLLVDTWMLTCIHTSQLKCVFWAHMWNLFSSHNWQYLWFLKTFLSSIISPVIFLPIHNRFYLSIWWVDRSLHRAVLWVTLEIESSTIPRLSLLEVSLPQDNDWIIRVALHQSNLAYLMFDTFSNIYLFFLQFGSYL